MKTKIVAGIIIFCTTLLIFPVAAQITMITEFAGVDIADWEANNWSNDAELIQILISEIVNYRTGEGELKKIPTGWAYVYRSDDKYLEVLVNVTDYENDAAGRIREMAPKGQYLEELEGKMSLPLDRDWKVTGNVAINMAFDQYGISLERGDGLYWLSLDMEDVLVGSERVPTPVWHVSISNGDTDLVTDYRINANLEYIIELPSDGSSSSAGDGPDIWTKLWTILPVISGVIVAAVAVIGLFIRSKRK